jgi:hypothetical protein
LRKRNISFFSIEGFLIGPMSISFTMKIRGVPFEAGEKEVFEVIKKATARN